MNTRTASQAIAVLGVAVPLAACGSPTLSPQVPVTHLVTDMAGVSVQVPAQISRIAEAWPAHTIIDEMLGVGQDLVAIPTNVTDIPFLAKVDPRIGSVPVLFNNIRFNIEDLLRRKPDIVFTAKGEADPKSIRAAGVPTVELNFTTFPELKQAVAITGQTLGGAATQRASAYNNYTDLNQIFQTTQ